MAKVYTSQEMRVVADNLDSVYVAPECEDKKEQYKYLSLASMMLRQAADAMEREKKYEYAHKYGEDVIAVNHTDDVTKCFVPMGAVMVRRPVGEWEEVYDQYIGKIKVTQRRKGVNNA